MKTIGSATVSAALIACTLSLVQAAPKTKDPSPAGQARMMLEDVDSLSISMANAADKLNLMAKSLEVTGSQMEGLDTLRYDINRIGRDLSTLQDEEASLPAWESQTIDALVPLMKEIATNTEEATDNFNSSRNHLWATQFPDEAAKVYQDAERVKEIVSGNLKLASAREREHHLEQTVNQ